MSLDWDGFSYNTPGSVDETPGESSSEIRRLEEKIDKLALICRAMWEILKAQTNISEEDLSKKVEEVDLSDGKLDGKVIHDVKRCRNCGRILNDRYTTCLYCGTENQFASVFDTI